MNVYNIKMPGVTYLDFFEYEGKKYPLGTIVKIKKAYKFDFPALYNGETTILQHNIEADKNVYYIFKGYNNGEIRWYSTLKSPDQWIESIVKVGDPNVDPCAKPIEYEKDSENGEVKFGWIVYILVMLGLFIFKDRWLGWIAASAYFFWWRKNKLQK